MTSFSLTFEVRKTAPKSDTDGARRLVTLAGEAGLFEEAEAAKGAAHEYGTDRLKRRQWMSVAIDSAQGKLDAAADAMVDKVLDGGDPDAALKDLAEDMADVMRDSLLAGNVSGDPLKDETINAKGSARKLIDSGDMLRAIDSRVVPEARPDADG